MSRTSKSLLLEDEIGLLVKHFGVEKVRAALSKILIKGNEESHSPVRKGAPNVKGPIHATIADALESIREQSPEKYRLLSQFLTHLKARDILPESQDIIHF